MNKTLQDKILKSKVVSFDMFDTLVLRIIDDPEILFDMMGKIFDIDNFREIRTSMQAECGLILQREKGYPHANIDEIYGYIKKNTDIKNTDELMKYEINKEIELLYQNKKIYEVFQYAKLLNKRIIVTSDMYLKMDTIKRILKKCGYSGIDRIYLSSFERKAKFDGSLYDYIIKEESVMPDEILHVGDSFKDDIDMAKSKGFDTYHYVETTIAKSESISSSISNGIIRLINQNEDDFWVRTGAKSGLMYLGLYNELCAKNYPIIHFLSRDGYNLYHLFKKYNRKQKVNYCYTSRRSLLLASISKLDDNALNNLPPFTIGQTVGEILDYVCMRDIFSAKDLNKVGFKSFEDRIKSFDDLERFKKIYTLKEKEVLKICEEERNNALKYFKNLDIIGNDNLFFDCGWNGSSQYLLENFINKYSSLTTIEFFYNGIFENAKSIKQLSERSYSAFLFDIGRNQHIANRVRDSIVILELFFGAPENSVFKYDKNGYILDDYEDSLGYKKLIYKGIELFFNYALPLFKEYNYEIIPKETLNPILRLIELPSEEEAVTIGNIENVDAFAKQNGVHKYIAKLTTSDIKNNPDTEVYWKYGLLKRSDINADVKKFVSKKYNLKSFNNCSVKVKVCGVNNPSVHIYGQCFNKTILNIKCGDSTLEYTFIPEATNNNLDVTSAIDKNTKKIMVVLLDENKNCIKKFTRFNNKSIRLLNKVLGLAEKPAHFFLRILRKVLRFFKSCVRKFKTFCRLVKKAWTKYHFIIPRRVMKNFIIGLFNKDIRSGFANPNIINPFNKNDYNQWLKSNETFSQVENLSYYPKISFVIPVYNVKGILLSECLNSILNQTYKNIEICLADDCSTNSETIDTLKEYENKYNNIKVVYRKKNGHISAASNSALELVTGEYVAMMDNDDIIPKNAIYEMVKALNNDKTIDMIYSDEDKLDLKSNRCDPHFKSDYAPDTLMSVNYFCHFTLLKTSILKEIGGWTVGLEGAQDWDLFLRFVEKAKNIYHLPKILYHWRMLEGSTSIGLSQKNYAMDTARKSIEAALERRKTPGIVHLHDKVPYYWIEYTYKKEPLISIIIPTKDYASTLNKCLKSIYGKTRYKNFEVIVVDNKSVEKETFNLFKKYEREYTNFRVVKADMEFNYSKINNLAVNNAMGDYVLLLNNDTEVISEDWLSIMVGYAMQDHVGAVGAKLIYPDKTIQHGGVVMGMGGVAGHVFVNSPMNYEGIYGRLCVPYNYSVVTAACLMIKKDKYLEVGGLSEELKVAYNDVDFCLKLIENGYYNLMVPMVELFHYESKSRGNEDTIEKKKRFEKEVEYMNSHWKKYIDNDPMYNPNLSKTAVFMLDKNKK